MPRLDMPTPPKSSEILFRKLYDFVWFGGVGQKNKLCSMGQAYQYYMYPVGVELSLRGGFNRFRRVSFYSTTVN